MKHLKKIIAGALGASLLGFFLLTTCTRIPPPRVDVLLEVGKQRPFPHDVFSAVLKKVVNSQGLVDYEKLREDRGELERYLELLARISPHSAPDLFPRQSDALSYWINAYNAQVLFAVSNDKDLRSVGDEKVRFFALRKYKLGGEYMSLYHLENAIVREEFADARIHMALNCASLGCPKLPVEAFDPDRLNDQLEREAKLFCGDKNNLRAISDHEFALSQIFEWYAEDFAKDGGALAFCQKRGITIPPGATLSYIPYDWGLNAQ